MEVLQTGLVHSDLAGRKLDWCLQDGISFRFQWRRQERSGFGVGSPLYPIACELAQSLEDKAGSGQECVDGTPTVVQSIVGFGQALEPPDRETNL